MAEDIKEENNLAEKKEKVTWRYLETGHLSAARNMAIDEAIMRLNKTTMLPTLRCYGWTPSAVSIGYFQELNQEIDLKRCDELGVDYVRRITGGGAVFHDSELTYSFIIDEKDEHAAISKNILESYEKICGAVIKGLAVLGLDCQFSPINDIILNGKKISGNAQTRRGGVILQHGTILMDVDVDKMFSLLLVPDEKIRDKMISNVKERVTSIHHESEDVDFNKAAEAIRSGFENRFDICLQKGELTEEERKLADELEKTRFSDKEWNHKR